MELDRLLDELRGIDGPVNEKGDWLDYWNDREYEAAGGWCWNGRSGETGGG